MEGPDDGVEIVGEDSAAVAQADNEIDDDDDSGAVPMEIDG